MNDILIPTITTQDITREELQDLSLLVSTRQQNPDFMRFLKESPMTAKQNLEVFKKEFDTPHCKFKSIKIDGITDPVGFLLFHCFQIDTQAIELGFRIDPGLQHRGICTHAVRQSISEILSVPNISNIVGWHSAWNKGSFGVFKKSGFQIVDFVPDQTFLPNIGKTTDDFQWQISPNDIAISPDKKSQIQSGLKKHNLVLHP